MSQEQQLHLLELCHPVHRLIDFWSGHFQTEKPNFSPREWSLEQWQNKQIHLHPQVKTPTLKAQWINCINQRQSLNLSQELTLVDGIVNVDSLMAACLFALWENSKSIRELAEIWQQLNPVDIMTLEPTHLTESLLIIKETIIALENWGYVLVA